VSGAAAFAARRLSSLRSLPGSLPAVSARLRRRLVALLVACLALGAGYQLWLRDSSLVAVDEVTVTGLTTSESKRVQMALTSAAGSMTTLNVDREQLERAVAAYPVVRELEITTDFPHGLRIHVVEHHAAAIAVSETGRLAVAGDGTILRGLGVEGRLPTVQVDGALAGDHLRDRAARAAAAVAGAAPAALRARLDEIVRRPQDGLVAELSDGPELIFGSAARLPAKWAAAARILADTEARGASYIDLSIPGRPAAGGLPAETVTPVAPAGVDPSTAVAPADASAAVPGAPVDPSATAGAAPAPPTTPGALAPSPPAVQAPPGTPPAPPPASGAAGGAAAPPAP
jgi:cell division protein FtsQ